MLSKAKTEFLLGKIRSGEDMTRGEMLNLIGLLSIPSILAQITNVMMFFIDQAMVGSLGAEAPAAIGLVESTIWLFGGLAGAASMGFSVQTAHFIGANDLTRAREVVRHSLLCCMAFALIMSATAAVISPISYIDDLETGKRYDFGDKPGPMSKKLFDTLRGIQYGEIEDKHGWTTVVIE